MQDFDDAKPATAPADIIEQELLRPQVASTDAMLHEAFRAMAELSATLLERDAPALHDIAAQHEFLRDAVEGARARLQAGVGGAHTGRVRIASASRETAPAAGLGDLLGEAAGEAALAARTRRTPLDDWAGETLGPVEISRRFGVARSTLDSWRRKGEVIALQKGLHASVYPTEQFRDGAPLRGLKPVLDAASGNPRVAWRWLRTPSPWFADRPPLDGLMADRAGDVAAAAERDLG